MYHPFPFVCGVIWFGINACLIVELAIMNLADGVICRRQWVDEEKTRKHFVIRTKICIRIRIIQKHSHTEFGFIGRLVNVRRCWECLFSAIKYIRCHVRNDTIFTPTNSMRAVRTIEILCVSSRSTFFFHSRPCIDWVMFYKFDLDGCAKWKWI